VQGKARGKAKAKAKDKARGGQRKRQRGHIKSGELSKVSIRIWQGYVRSRRV
jgi:hypothetical protein